MNNGHAFPARLLRCLLIPLTIGGGPSGPCRTATDFSLGDVKGFSRPFAPLTIEDGPSGNPFPLVPPKAGLVPCEAAACPVEGGGIGNPVPAFRHSCGGRGAGMREM